MDSSYSNCIMSLSQTVAEQAKTISEQAKLIEQLKQQLANQPTPNKEIEEENDNLKALCDEKDQVIKKLMKKFKKKQEEPEFIDEPEPKKKSKKTTKKTKEKPLKVISKSNNLDLNMFEDL